ncbi:MAG: hypothetical protein M0042_05180 [Nitrospiraceae bacterium]|nr:hypothetical protein [Nitrospiraceae bacterium]
MAWKQALYGDVRSQMKAGDVIAFSGKGNFSEIIKWATRSTVSHVGVILQSKLMIDATPQAGIFNQIIESTSLNGFSGVTISRLSDRLDTYDGDIWWLPLNKDVHDSMDKRRFYDFLIHQNRKQYDTPQAVKSALDALDNVPILGRATHNIEDFSRFFCSELVTAGLEAAGAISHINASEVTPIDLCSFALYENDYVQLKGNRRQISGYNSTNPVGWGE